MGDAEALDGMARALLRRGVTSFLPTAVTAPFATLPRSRNGFAAGSRSRRPTGRRHSASTSKGRSSPPSTRGAHDPAFLRAPADVAPAELDPLLDGLRLMTIAPELPGALDLIPRLRRRGVTVSLGHSAASLEQARAGFAAGGVATTHLFNAMSGIDHHAPGLAAAALADDAVYVELIADGEHVDPALWPIVARVKPRDRLVLVSDAIALAGRGDGRTTIGGLDVEVAAGRATLAGTSTLAGSVIALDTAVRNLALAGIPLPAAVAAATRNPLAMLRIVDRGRIAIGQRADLVELDDDLRVRRVLRAGREVESRLVALLRGRASRALSQSARNWTMPLSVSGWWTICWRTLKGIVAMCAPASAAWVMWSGWRIDAARTSVSSS